MILQLGKSGQNCHRHPQNATRHPFSTSQDADQVNFDECVKSFRYDIYSDCSKRIVSSRCRPPEIAPSHLVSKSQPYSPNHLLTTLSAVLQRIEIRSLHKPTQGSHRRDSAPSFLSIPPERLLRSSPPLRSESPFFSEWSVVKPPLPVLPANHRT